MKYKLSSFPWHLIIITVALILRVYVAMNTQDSAQSSYSSIAKSSLNYRWSRIDLKQETEKWLDGTELKKRAYSLPNGEVNLKALETELIGNNHPPLYYLILHLAMAVADEDVPTFKPALFINLLFFALTMLLLYELIRFLFKDKKSALFGLTLFGFSLAPMNVLILLKGYELQVFFAVAQMLVILKQSEKDKLEFKDFGLFFLACIGGFFTHYFSYIFTFGLCIIIAFLYWNKDRTRLYGYAGTVLFSISSALYIYPYSLKDIIFTHRAAQIRGKLIDPEKAKIGVLEMTENLQLVYSNVLLIALGIVMITLVISQWKRLKQISIFDEIRKHQKLIYTILLGGVLFCFCQYLSPFNKLRYVSFTIPFLYLPVIFLVNQTKKWRVVLMAVLSVIILSLTIRDISNAIQGKTSSSSVLQNWETQKVMQGIDDNESILIITTKTGENSRPYLFHAAPRDIAFSINELNLDLLSQRENVVVIVDKRLAKKDRSIARKMLKELGFEKKGKVRSLPFYRKKK